MRIRNKELKNQNEKVNNIPSHFFSYFVNKLFIKPCKMKKSRLVIIFAFTINFVFAQKSALKEINPYSKIDDRALQLPDSLTTNTDNISKYIVSNFNTNTEKARAIFIWIASNIQYDIDNMFAINFYENREDKILKPLKTRKGICENYAALFDDICNKSGIRSLIIEGYTKQNGFADYVPHAWCAAFIDTSWFMFDPTWGSGYVSNSKFYKKINNNYFKATPAALIRSHMPFDYLWEFLNYPITNQEFYEDKVEENKSKPFFNYVDSLTSYEKLNHVEQITAEAARVEKNGVKNSLVFDKLQHLKLEIESDKQNSTIGLYNSAGYDYNSSMFYFNKFIEYFNKQFNP